MAGKLQLRGEMYKTVNSMCFDSTVDDEFSSLDGGGEEQVLRYESCFSTTTTSEDLLEAVIGSLGRSTSTHRFFFDQGPPAINSSLLATTSSTPPPKSAPSAAPDVLEPDLDDDGKDWQRARAAWRWRRRMLTMYILVLQEPISLCGPSSGFAYR
jgi:hypothetical protein